MVYSPTVLPRKFATNTSDPDTAMPSGSTNPETSEAFTVAPDVVYAPIVFAGPFVTRISSARAALLDNNPSRTRKQAS